MQTTIPSIDHITHAAASHHHWQPGDAGPPTDFLVAVYFGRTQAERATHMLRGQGVVAEDIFTYHGPSGLQELHDREPSSILHRILMTFDALAADDGAASISAWSSCASGAPLFWSTSPCLKSATSPRARCARPSPPT